MSTVIDPRLQTLLNSAVRRGDYAEVALVMAQANAEVTQKYRKRCLCPDGTPHKFVTAHDTQGWPEKCACACGAATPDAFCRQPMVCRLAGRCMSEVACND